MLSLTSPPETCWGRALRTSSRLWFRMQTAGCETLSRGGGRSILCTPIRHGSEVATAVTILPGRYQEVAENLRVKKVVVGEGEQRPGAREPPSATASIRKRYQAGGQAGTPALPSGHRMATTRIVSRKGVGEMPARPRPAGPRRPALRL